MRLWELVFGILLVWICSRESRGTNLCGIWPCGTRSWSWSSFCWSTRSCCKLRWLVYSDSYRPRVYRPKKSQNISTYPALNRKWVELEQVNNWFLNFFKLLQIFGDFSSCLSLLCILLRLNLYSKIINLTKTIQEKWACFVYKFRQLFSNLCKRIYKYWN